jgi:arginine:ornithine antiporter/lysine permease
VGLIYAAGAKHLLLSAVIYGPGSILFIVARREGGKTVFTPSELIMFAAASLGAAIAVYSITTGLISV